MNRNGSIIMMDEFNTNESNEYLQIHLNPEPVLIRLPMYCARADFPYKGYMIGLVDDFVALKRKYPDIVLEIFPGGDDIGELEDKINSVPWQFKKRN